MSDTNINIVVKAQDQTKAAVNSVKSGLDGLENKANSSGVSLANGIKNTIKPATDLLMAFRRVGFVAGATFGTLTALAVNSSNEIKKMTSASIDLGISTEDVARKFYGMVGATDEIKKGLNSVNSGLNEWQKLTLQVGNWWGTMVGKIVAGSQAIADSFGENRGIDYFLTRMSIENKNTAEEMIATATAVKNELNKLTMTDTQYKEAQWNKQLAKWKQVEGDKTEISRLEQAKREKSIIDHVKESNKLLAAKRTMSGDAVGALRVTQNNDYLNYKQEGHSEKELEMFKENQAEAMRIAKMTATGVQQAWDDSIDGMKGSFSSMFEDAFTGQLKKASDYFKSFTQSLASAWAKAMSEMTVNSILGRSGGWAELFSGGIKGLFGGFGGGASSAGTSASANGLTMSQGFQAAGYMHSGGVIKAHSGLAVGEVPIIAQEGEGILSRKGMANLAKLNTGKVGGGSGVTINIVPVIQAWDSNDVYRNRALIIDAVSQEIQNNGNLRQIIKRYA